MLERDYERRVSLLIPVVISLSIVNRGVAMSRYVCLSVRMHISETTRTRFAEFSAHDHGSVFLIWRCDMPCTSCMSCISWMTSCLHIDREKATNFLLVFT